MTHENLSRSDEQPQMSEHELRKLAELAKVWTRGAGERPVDPNETYLNFYELRPPRQ